MDKGIASPIIERRQWTEQLCSLRFPAPPGSHFIAGQFIRVGLDLKQELEDKFIARPYSLVNSPDSDIWEIYFNRVPEGPLSTALFNSDVDDKVWLHPHANGFFTLDEVPKAEQLWLIATGTGIGPYLSMLQTQEPWQDYRQIILIHGIKREADKAYNALIESLQQRYQQQLHVCYSITQQQVAGSLNKRIPQALESGELEQFLGLRLEKQNSQVMLCGNPAMVKEMTQCLIDRGLSKNRRRTPGEITTEIYR